MRSFCVLGTLALITMGIGGCPGSDWVTNIKKAAKTGVQTVPAAKEMTELFSDTNSFIANSPGNPVQWNTQAFFYDRYELTMQVDVELSLSWDRVIKVLGDPKFYLSEVESVKRLPDGRYYITYVANTGRDFGPVEWKKIVDAHGDFSAIGYIMKTDQPVPNFRVVHDEYRQDK